VGAAPVAGVLANPIARPSAELIALAEALLPDMVRGELLEFRWSGCNSSPDQRRFAARLDSGASCQRAQCHHAVKFKPGSTSNDFVRHPAQHRSSVLAVLSSGMGISCGSRVLFEHSIVIPMALSPSTRRLKMTINRRQFIEATAAGLAALVAPAYATRRGVAPMYGLIGKMMAVRGQREALVSILLEGVSGMPGCLSYVVAQDPGDPDAIWVTEVWDSQASHKASLSLPAVKAAIARGKPLIASFDQYIETTPVGGQGLVSAK
jgi:quinol monooxygenase YgiN